MGTMRSCSREPPRAEAALLEHLHCTTRKLRPGDTLWRLTTSKWGTRKSAGPAPQRRQCSPGLGQGSLSCTPHCTQPA